MVVRVKNRLDQDTWQWFCRARHLTISIASSRFEVRTDVTMSHGFRWLTVSPQAQPDLEIALMEPKGGTGGGGMLDEEMARQIRALVEKGALVTGAFDTDDCQAAYEEMKSRGVEFLSLPTQRPYGLEAVFKDNSSNWFALTQHTQQ